MNDFHRLLTSLLFTLVSFTAVTAQKPPQINTDSTTAAKPFDIKDYQDWKQVDLREFSLYLPKDYKIEPKIADLPLWMYKTNEVQLMVYYGTRLPVQSSIERDFSTFDEKYLFINQIYTHISSYEYEIKDWHYFYNYVARYYTETENDGKGLAIVLYTKNNSKELAEKIFLSVKLNNTLKIKDKKSIKNARF